MIHKFSRQIWGKDVFQATFCDDLSKKDEGTTGTKTLYFSFSFLGIGTMKGNFYENSNCCYGKSRSKHTHVQWKCTNTVTYFWCL